MSSTVLPDFHEAAEEYSLAAAVPALYIGGKPMYNYMEYPREALVRNAEAS